VKVFRLSVLAISGLPILFACGGDNLTLPSEGTPAHIQIDGGNGQSGVINSELAPITFLVTDSQNRPVPGAAVDFVLQQDAGGGAVNPTSGETNAEGQVSTTITLGTQVGDLVGLAQVQVPEGTTPVQIEFTAKAVSSDANKLSLVSGDLQTGAVGTPLALPLVVRVTDNFDNPVAGVTVNWEAVGGGTVDPATTVSNENGEVSVTRTLGPTSGQQQTRASADGLAGSPVTFTHTATAGNASSVTIVSGNNQEAPAGSKLPQPLVVKVLDQDGNPIPNRAVSWVIGDGAGTPNPATSNTGADGQASTEWTLGPNPGGNTLNAVVSGVGTATFSANGTGTGSPSNLALTTQPPSSVTVGATLSPAPVVQVRDNSGHDLAVPGINVIVAISSGRGQLSGTTTVATDANGQATFGDLKISGATGSHRLIFSAEGFRSATSNKIEVEKASTSTSIASDDPDPSDPNQPVTVIFSVSSPVGTPTGNVEVTASGGGESCTATVAQGSCQITLTGTGDRTLTATYKGDDVFASSSGTALHHVNEPPPPPANNPPIAQPDAYSTPAGIVLSVPAPGVLANDVDPEGGTLTARLTGSPSQGLVTLNEDGSFTYFPGGLSGTVDTFTYEVSDGTSSVTQTVTITVS